MKHRKDTSGRKGLRKKGIVKVDDDDIKEPTKRQTQTEIVEEKRVRRRNRHIGFTIGLSLYIMTADEIKKRSECTIESEKDVCSLKMGPTDPTGTPCGKCASGLRNCIGHWGHIVLAVPIPNPLYMQAILMILKLFCYNTWAAESTKGRIEPLFPNTIDFGSEISGITKLKMLVGMAKDKTALDALTKEKIKGCRKFKNEKDSPFIIFENDVGDKKCGNKTNPRDIQNFFAAIERGKDPIDDVPWIEKIGLKNTPISALILTNFPVVPNTVRLGTKTEEGMERDDHLTGFYKRIVIASSELNNILFGTNSKFEEVCTSKQSTKESGGKESGSNARDLYIEMYDNIRDLILKKDDAQDQSSFKNQQLTRSITTRVNGKNGTMRRVVLGKRGDYSGRTVLIGDYRIPMDHIGIPYLFAKKITIPEDVTFENVDDINRLIAEGDMVKELFRRGKPVNLTETTLALKGDRITRFIKDGDPVVFSRQPVLHKGSIMCYRARIMPLSAGNVFRINLAVTTPHNADFDGDEGNVAVPQNPWARAEVLQKMLSTNCIRGDAASAPLIGLIQDSIIGASRLTRPGVIVDQSTYLRAAAQIEFGDVKRHMERCRNNKLRAFSGRAFFSMLFPINFSYSKKMKGDSEDIVIEKGLLMSGILNKNTLGRKSNSIIDALYLFNGDIEEGKSGPILAADFLSKSQILLQVWLDTQGFSIGYNDCVLPDNLGTKVQKMIEDATSSIRKLQEQRPTLESSIKVSEIKINTIATRLKFKITKLIKESGLVVTNRLLQMIDSGAKGEILNATQILALVGQQEFKGGRIPFTLQSKTKVLPHFDVFSTDPLARGLCTSSFSKGLSPLEYYMHAIATRPNMVETNLSPAETGYFYRRLWIMLEDMFSHKDQTIRDENGRIVQFLYGGDGFDPQFMVSSGGKNQFINIQQTINEIRASSELE